MKENKIFLLTPNHSPAATVLIVCSSFDNTPKIKNCEFKICSSFPHVFLTPLHSGFCSHYNSIALSSRSTITYTVVKSNGQFSAPPLLHPSPVFYTVNYFLVQEALAKLGKKGRFFSNITSHTLF